MDYNDIRALLTKYYDAETSRGEEQALADFFASHSDLPEDLKADKAVFDSLRSAAEKIQAPIDLDTKIMDTINRDLETRQKESESKGRRRRAWKVLSAISAAAAIIAIAILIPFTADFKSDIPSDVQLASAIREDSVTDTEYDNVGSISEKQGNIPAQDLAKEAVRNVETPTTDYKKSTSTQASDSKKGSTDEDNISEEELKALHEGLAALAKAGRKIAMAKERISDTENAVNNSLEEISGILNK